MALADTAKLAVDLSLKGNFTSSLKAAERSLSSFDKHVDGTQGRAYKAGTQIGVGIKRGAVLAAGAIGFLATNVALGLRSLSELETVTAQTNAVLKSTKGVAGETAAEIRTLAEKYESLNATIDDKVIQSGENLLLTFTNIRKEGFEPALKAALDMNTALGRGESGLNGTVRVLGRALNDPAKGLAALTRLGVTFTDTQKKQIAAALKNNDTLGAQSIILAELNKRYGGSFLAGGNTTTGKIAKFKDAIEELQKALATALLPTIGKVADALSKWLADPAVVRTVGQLGDKIAGLFSDNNIGQVGKVLSGVFDTAKAAAPILEQTANATLTIVKAAVGLFTSLPKEIQGLAVGAFAVNKLTGGLVTNIVGGIADFLLKQRGATPANPLFVADVTGGLGGAAGAAGAGGGLLGKAASLVTKVFIVGLAAEAADLIHGAISPGGGLEGRTQNNTLLLGDQLAWPFGPKNTPHIDIGPFKNILGGDSTFVADAPILTTLLDRGGRETGRGGNVTAGGFDRRLADEVAASFSSVGQKLAHSIAFLHNAELHQVVQALRAAKNDDAIRKALKDAMSTIFTKGLGGSGGAKNTLAGLKEALKHTHDPQLQRELREAIAKVERKVTGREWVERQLHKADQIIRSEHSTRSKIADLQKVEQALKDRGLPAAANRIRAKIDEEKRKLATETALVKAAVVAKKLAVTFSPTINTNVRVSSRETSKTQTTFKKYYVTAS